MAIVGDYEAVWYKKIGFADKSYKRTYIIQRITPLFFENLPLFYILIIICMNAKINMRILQNGFIIYQKK